MAKVRQEDYYVCEGCGILYEVDSETDERDFLGNRFCDNCAEKADRAFIDFWDGVEADRILDPPY